MVTEARQAPILALSKAYTITSGRQRVEVWEVLVVPLNQKEWREIQGGAVGLTEVLVWRCHAASSVIFKDGAAWEGGERPGPTVQILERHCRAPRVL
jgi:hypothetical protein